jgi:thioredoxin reductase (NADPH)
MTSQAIETDTVVIGAGPAGLFQVFELGLLEIGAHIVDSLPVPGGQLIELYADKPIYDIPGIPACTARELVDSLLKQAAPFKPQLHLGQEVSALAVQVDGRLAIETSAGTRFLAKAVVIAGGVGAFQPRRLAVAGLERHFDTQVFHGLRDPHALTGQHVVVAGGVDAALAAALALTEPGGLRPASVTLLHRRDVFQAEADTIERVHERIASGALRFVAGQPTGLDETPDGRLAALQVTHGDAQTLRLPLDTLVVGLGLSPKLGPLADWGVVLERKQVVVDTGTFQTNVPGVFAIGDIVTYPGKKRLILSAFHEAALASFGIAALVYPDQRIQLQYTTTSTRLHELLGVPHT